MSTIQDVVFFVPGFLGFERAGNLEHFGERLCSALRTALESKLGRSVPVIALTSLPTRSLAQRQRALLRTLSARVLELGGARRVHLVGHGPGGVDAALLACEHSLQGVSWAQLGDVADVRARLSSVTTLSSPHYGTCLANAKGAGALTLKALRKDREGAGEVLRLVTKLVGSALRDVEREDLWFALAREGRKVSHFVAELARWQGLMAAYTPGAMEELQARCVPMPQVQRRSFITVAGRAVEGARKADGPDTFFAELYQRTAARSGFDPQSSSVQATMEAVRSALADPARVIVSAHAKPPSLVDASCNDGLINAARQLLAPRDERSLAAVVVGDHFDVIGYYDRFTVRDSRPGRESQREVLSGLFHSGSHFRDDEFFALYRKMAEVIAESVEEPARAPASRQEASPSKKSSKRKPKQAGESAAS